jgi:hypothetical protein
MMATVDAELMAAVRELSLESPGMGVKKLAAAVKQRDVQCGTKEVRAALKLLKADATATTSPPVSAMDVDVEEGESAAANDDMEYDTARYVINRADAELYVIYRADAELMTDTDLTDAELAPW